MNSLRGVCVAYCLLSFGSNLGDRRLLVVRALDELRAEGGLNLIQCSRLFETPPIGGPEGQSVFINATAVAETQYSARQVLGLLQSVEAKLGRVRYRRWDSRTIDLDLLLYGNLIGNNLELTLPHPRFATRAFVLRPARDVAANWRDPRSGWTIEKLDTHLSASVPSLALSGGDARLREKICERLADAGVAIVHRGQTSEPQRNVVGHATIYRPSPVDTSTLPRPPHDDAWVSDYVPETMDDADPLAPRAIGRLNPLAGTNLWPDPRRVWRNGWLWPECQIDANSEEQAAQEILAALSAMECQVIPITESGDWRENL